MVTEVKPVLAKALLPIVVTLLLSQEIDFKLSQPPNELSPIDVTELGIVTDVKPLQLSKAYFPIAVTEYVLPLYVTEEGMISSPLTQEYQS